MGRDCTLWALDPEKGQLLQCGLDRLSTFDYVDGVNNVFCRDFISKEDANHWLVHFRKTYDKWEDSEQKEYHLFWVYVAQQFVDICPEDFLFTIVEEESDVEDRRKKYAHDVVHAQWPRCPVCEFPAGFLKKADRWSEHSVGVYTAECSHMGKGEKLIFEAPPINLKKWVIDLALPDYGEKFHRV